MKTVIVGVNSKFIHTMLSVRYLAESLNESLRSADSFCVYREFTVNMDKEAVLEALYREKGEVYAFSTYIFNVDFVFAIIKNLKKLLPRAVVILGGPEVSYENEGFLRQYPEVDFISCGEGEVSFPNLVNTVSSRLSDPKKAVFEEKCGGVAFLYNNEYVSFPPPPPVCDLDTLPFPYTEEELADSGTKILYYESSRGCPFNCSYCLSSAERGVRFKSVERVQQELDRFLAHGVRLVKFIDRTFNADRERGEKIVSYIIEKDNGVTGFHFEVAPWLVTDGFIELLKNAREGLFQLEIGIQSTNPETLRAINRNVSFETVAAAIERYKETGVHLHVDLIAGLPHETYEIFGRSFDDVMALDCDCLQLGFLKMLRGTAITHQDEHEYIYEDSAPYQVLCNKYISYTELRKLEKVAKLLDLYLNSHLCGFLSGKRLQRIFGVSPFEFYTAFAEHLEGLGFFDVLHSTVDLFGFLYGFLETRYDPDLCESLVAYEFYSYVGAAGGTDWLRTMPDKQGCIELLRDKETLRGFAGERIMEIVESYDVKHWFRKSQLVKFDFDENGEKNPRKILFLYGKRTEKVVLE